MEKSELRKHLKRLQLIVNNKGDEELPEVVTRLKSAIVEIEPSLKVAETPLVEKNMTADQAEERSEKKGRDRIHRGGRDRSY